MTIRLDSLNRRTLVQGSLALGGLGLLSSLLGCATAGGIPAKARVVVVGGGYGGATAAKYVRLLSDYKIDVVMVEPSDSFVSCPISNLVLGGSKTINDVTTPYTSLSSKHGVKVVKDMVASIDAGKKTVTLAGGASIAYDKLVLSPGIEMMCSGTAMLGQRNAVITVSHAVRFGEPTASQFPKPLSCQISVLYRLDRSICGRIMACHPASRSSHPNGKTP